MTESIAAPAHVVALRFSGRPDPEDSEVVHAALEATAAVHDDVALYVEIGWVHGLTAEQFVDDFRDGLARLPRHPRLLRIAVVTGSYERRSVVRAETARDIAPEVLAFPVGSGSAAMEWASEGGTPRVYVA